MDPLVPLIPYHPPQKPGGCWDLPCPPPPTSFLSSLGYFSKSLAQGCGPPASIPSIPHRSIPKLHHPEAQPSMPSRLCSGLTQDPPLSLQPRQPTPTGSTSTQLLSGHLDQWPLSPSWHPVTTALHPNPQLQVIPFCSLPPRGREGPG